MQIVKVEKKMNNEVSQEEVNIEEMLLSINFEYSPIIKWLRLTFIAHMCVMTGCPNICRTIPNHHHHLTRDSISINPLSIQSGSICSLLSLLANLYLSPIPIRLR